MRLDCSFMSIGDFSSMPTVKRLSEFYYEHVKLTQKLIEYLFDKLKSNPNERVDVAYFLIFGLISTGQAIIILAQSGKITECFMLARSVVERIITILYLLICEDEEFERFNVYTKQKAARMMNREVGLNELKAVLKASNYDEIINKPEIKEAIEMFTSKRGKKITRWNKRSINQMLDVIAEKGLDIRYLLLAVLAIYDEASEALHGTIYGSIFHTGVFTTGVPSKKSELEKTWCSQLSMLLLSLGTCMNSLFKGINKKYPIEELVNESNSILKGIKRGKNAGS